MLWGAYAGRRSRRVVLAATAWRRYLVAGLAATLLCVLLPGGLQVGAMVLVLVSSIGAGVIGLSRQRAQSAPPWLLLLLARGSGVAALCLGTVNAPGVHSDGSAVGALMLLPYPLLAAATTLVVWRRLTAWSWIAAINAAILGTFLVILSWSLVVLPMVRSNRVADLQYAVTIGYVALDLVGLAFVGRALFMRARRSPASLLVASAALATCAGDLALLAPGPLAVIDTRPLATGIWVVASVLLGAACLHPSVARRDPDQPAEQHEDVRSIRLGASVAMLVVAFATPTAASALFGDGRWPTAAVAALLTGVLAGLLLTRLAISVRGVHRRAANLARRISILDGQARGLSDKATALDVVLQEHREQQRDLEYLATHDAVTMLANRTLFGQRLDRAMDLVGHHTGVALLLLDLDGFKTVNDTLGHLVGDQLLRVVSQRLLELVPSTQTVARLGGDEFAILMTGVREPSEAWDLAQQVLAAVSSPYAFGDQQVSVTVSIGIRHLPRFRSESPTDMMQHADTAMYAAKRSGKNRASLYGRDQNPAPASHGLEPVGTMPG